MKVAWDDEDGRTVTRLSLAARAGTLSDVCSLCDNGANVNYAYEWDGWDFGMKLYVTPTRDRAMTGTLTRLDGARVRRQLHVPRRR